MNDTDILTDFRRKYEGTFVFIKDPSLRKKDLFLINSIEDSSEFLGVLNLESPKLGNLRINLGSEHSIVFPEVPVGVFQHGNVSMICRRKPRKQYRRGICSDNSSLLDATHRVYPNGTAFNFPALVNAFEKKQFTFKQALQLLNTKKYKSVAIKGNYTLSLPISEGGVDFLLLFWDIPIAYITNEGTVAKVCQKTFTTEINKLLSGESDEYSI